MTEPTAYLIRAVGFANGAPCPHADQWLESFEHEAYSGRGYGTFTSSVRHAKRFATMADALAFWGKQSRAYPLRADGLPNKPLTALTVEIERLP